MATVVMQMGINVTLYVQCSSSF